MGVIRAIMARMVTVLRGHQRADDDLRAELESHLDMETREYMRRGMHPDEARRRALVVSGGLTQAAERVRQQRGVPWIEAVVADARYAFRHFGRTPMATITIILVLALGIGTNVVLFTVVNSLVTQPPPGISRDESLVRIRGTARLKGIQGVHDRRMSWAEVQGYASRTDLFADVGAHVDEIAVVETGQGTSTPTATVTFASANYFDLLNVRATLGTVPASEPDVMRLTTSPTAMISHAMWEQGFGRAADVVGRLVRINGVSVQIVGVAPPRFAGTGDGGAMVVWMPLAAYPALHGRSTAVFTSPDSLAFTAMGRLRPGVERDVATRGAAELAARQIQRDGQSAPVGPGDLRSPIDRIESASADVVPLLASNSRLGDPTDRLVSAVTAVGFSLLVLLITCTNVSALMVGLAVARRREIGVRLSLGAPRARLIRQLLTESTLLALIAAALGLVVTAIGIRLIGTRLDDLSLVIDWRVTIATCSVALITGVLFGLSPALHATGVSVSDVLKSSSATVAATRSRLQRALVVGQIGLTQPLLLGLGVVITTMVTDAGSRSASRAPDRIVEIELDPWTARLSDDARASRIAAAVTRVATMPGVVAAMPMEMGTVIAPLVVHPADRIPGVTPDVVMETRLAAAPKGYFGAFDIPIVRGRDFGAEDYAHASNDPGVPAAFETVIIGSDLAQRLWGNADPLGRRMTMPGASAADRLPMVVVGVVDAAAAGPSEVHDQVRVYVPYATIYSGVIARTNGPALPLIESMRQVVAAEAPQMPILRAQTVEQRDAELRRALLRASGAVAAGGLLALLLSAIGLYAVVSLAVGQSTREIGIRTALGARSRQVVRLFFAKGLALSAVGLLVGLPLSMIVTRVILTTLNWPLTSSPVLGLAIAVVVLVVASIAAWIPARRASMVDPNIALRID